VPLATDLKLETSFKAEQIIKQENGALNISAGSLVNVSSLITIPNDYKNTQVASVLVAVKVLQFSEHGSEISIAPEDVACSGPKKLIVEIDKCTLPVTRTLKNSFYFLKTGLFKLCVECVDAQSMVLLTPASCTYLVISS